MPMRRLREQPFPCLRILHDDGADGAILRRLQDLLHRVPLGIDRLRLALLVERKDLWGDGFTHRIANAYVVIHAYANLLSHDASLLWRLRRPAASSRLIPGHRQG